MKKFRILFMVIVLTIVVTIPVNADDETRTIQVITFPPEWFEGIEDVTERPTGSEAATVAAPPAAPTEETAEPVQPAAANFMIDPDDSPEEDNGFEIDNYTVLLYAIIALLAIIAIILVVKKR
jgi:hypothetical protein